MNDIVRTEQENTDGSIKLFAMVKEYLATCNGKKYTTEYASDFINLESVASAYGLNLKLVNSVSSILTGLGILGTFLGLCSAVKGFDSSSSEGIQLSINTLLAGMSTAFFTSVFGMLTSLIFLWREKAILNKLSVSLSNCCSKLDSKYHRSVDCAIVESFCFEDEEGNRYLPSESLLQVQNAVKKMRASVDRLGSDLYDSIGNALDTSFQDKLVPILGELSKKLENPAQAVTDSLLQELKNVSNDFSNNMTQSVNDKMDELLERFIDASNSILTIPDAVSELNKPLQAAAEALDKQILRLNNLSESFAANLSKMSDISAIITELHSKLEVMPQAVTDATSSIARSASEINNAQQGVVETLQNIKTVNAETSETVKEYADNIRKIQSGLSDIFEEIKNGLSQYSDSVRKSLQDMLNPFTSSVKDATENVANAIAPLNDAVSDLNGFSDSLKGMLGEIETSFKSMERELGKLSKIKSSSSAEA